MVQLTMTHEEAVVLREVLSSHLSDLRMEIVDTDSMSFRESLKGREGVLKKILEQLDGALHSPGMPS